MPGVVSLPHGWGHDLDGSALSVAAERPGVNTNRLSTGAMDPISGNAVLNGIPSTWSRPEAGFGPTSGVRLEPWRHGMRSGAASHQGIRRPSADRRRAGEGSRSGAEGAFPPVTTSGGTSSSSGIVNNCR